jgi:hypothetical protein
MDHSEIEDHEEQLRQAMLNSDVGRLERLLSPSLIFTNQDGTRLTKEDDLATHRSGNLKIETLEQVGEVTIRLLGDTAIVCLNAALTGSYAEQPFGGTFAYSRIWYRQAGAWQVEMAHCSQVSRS